MSGTVDIRVIALPDDARAEEGARRILSPAERVHADRFHFARDRRRFTLRRAALRHLVAHRLAKAPDAVLIEPGRNGKPALAGGDATSGLQFSQSASGWTTLVALVEGPPLGADLEAVRPMPDLDGVSRLVFTPAERRSLDRLAGAARLRAFFAGWTRKEAYLKATGDGLLTEPSRIEVSFDDAPRLVSVDGVAPRNGRWSLADLDPGEGLAGAVAIPGTGWGFERTACSYASVCG